MHSFSSGAAASVFVGRGGHSVDGTSVAQAVHLNNSKWLTVVGL